MEKPLIGLSNQWNLSFLENKPLFDYTDLESDLAVIRKRKLRLGR
jgi:hypothetical protein